MARVAGTLFLRSDVGGCGGCGRYMRRLRGPPGKSKPVRYTRVTASHSNPSVTFGGPVFKARALSEYQRRVPADHHLPEPLIAKVHTHLLSSLSACPLHFSHSRGG